MEGKNVVPMEITYMDTEDEYKYMVSKIHKFKGTYIQIAYVVFGGHQNTYIQIHF
jgi:hypothetical protein